MVGGAGCVDDGDVMEGGEPVLVFTAASPLFTALELLPKLHYLLESNRWGGEDMKTETLFYVQYQPSMGMPTDFMFSFTSVL